MVARAGRAPCLLIATDDVRLVSVPYEECETDEQKYERFDVWKDPADPRVIKVEVARGRDAMGAKAWRTVEFTHEDMVGLPRTIVLGLLEMLGNTGALGETAADRKEVA